MAINWSLIWAGLFPQNQIHIKKYTSKIEQQDEYLLKFPAY